MLKSGYLKSNSLLFTGLILLAGGLPLSLFLTSLSQFILAGSFFLEGNVKEKFNRFIKNRMAVLLCGIWLMHVIGLLWTTDLHEGLKDIRIKLPLLILPLVLAGAGPVTERQFRWVLYVFIGSVFTGTLISLSVMTGIIQRPVHDIRDIFIFHISHIRFSLFTCLALFSLAWFQLNKGIRYSGKVRLGMALLAVWLIAFLIIVESVTGIVILIITTTMMVLFQSLTRGTARTRMILFGFVLVFLIGSALMTRTLVRDFYARIPYPFHYDERTKLGHAYEFYEGPDQLYENGYPVFAYISTEELRGAWNHRSKIPFDSLDQRNQPVQYTLLRFLSSKGLKKDAEGVNNLSVSEVKSIENGIANVKYQDLSSIHSRLMQILWEIDYFRKGGNPSGHSVTQRIEFWTAACGIIEKYPWTGVGTGDMPLAYKNQYKEMRTKLTEPFRLRAHNQYLAITVAFGFPGLVYFLFVLVSLIIKNRMYRNFLFISSWLIAFFSMFTEDTLETQPGATFLAFFLSFFLFSASRESPGIHDQIPAVSDSI